MILISYCMTINSFVSDDIIDIYVRRGLAVLERKPVASDIAFLGRSYYADIQKKGMFRHWSLPVTVNYIFSSHSFGDDGQVAPLLNQFTGSVVRFSDISLFCRLCEANKVRSVNKAALGFDRGGLPITAAQPFGAFRDDQVTTLLAPTVIDFNASKQQVQCNVTALYRYIPYDDERYCLTTGLSVPFSSVTYLFNTRFSGSSLYREAFTAGQTQREDTLKQFLREYSSIDDFFVRGILSKKGMFFKQTNQKTGIGDLLLFSTIDCAGIFKKAVQSFQGGIALVIPSGLKSNQNILFDPSLSNNCLNLDLFVNMLFNTPLRAFNPFVRGAVEASLTTYKPFGGIRAPRLVMQNQTRQLVSKVSDLLTPDIAFANFENYWVDEFSAYDSNLAVFGDTTADINQRQGTQVVVGVGNYAYNVAHIGSRLCLLYTYMYKGHDSFSGNTTMFDVAALRKRTQAQAHTISWSIAWPGKIFDLFVGSEHIIAGQNIVRDNRLFASCAATF